MGFFAGKKKGLRSALPQERIDTLNKLPADDEKQFVKCALEDEDQRVRLVAARRVRSHGGLQQLLNHRDSEIVNLMKNGLSADAGRRLKTCSFAEGRALLDLVSDGVFAEIALQGKDQELRSETARRFFALAEPPIQGLINFAISERSTDWAKQALAQLTQRSQLKQVAKKARIQAIREQAEQLIAEQRHEQAQPSHEQGRRSRRARLQAIADESSTLSLRSSWDITAVRFAELSQLVTGLLAEQQEVSLDEQEEDYVERIRRSTELFAERKQQFSDRLQRCESILAGPIDPTDDTQRALFMELLGAFEDEEVALPLQQRYPPKPPEMIEATEGSLRTPTEDLQEPVSLVAIDEEALAKLNTQAKELAESDDLRKAADAFQLLHKEWMIIFAGVPKNDPRRDAFNESWFQLKQRRKALREQQDVLNEQHANQMKDLLVQLEALVPRAGTEGAAVQKERKQLRQKWKDMPKIPARLSGSLKNDYRRIDQELESALSDWFQQRDWERFAHVAPAQDLCEQAEALLHEGGPQEADLLASVRDLQARWKENGPLPDAKNEELWPRFRSACDAVFESLKPWFEQRDAERGENLITREKLVERLAIVVDETSTIGLVGSAASKDHENRRFEQVQALQGEWKAAGSVAPAARKELDKKWKALLDQFYGNRRQQRAQQEAEYAENVPLKEALIELLDGLIRDAEAAQAGMLPTKVLDDVLAKLRQARRDWRGIGYVPKADIARLRELWETKNNRLEELFEDRLAEERAAEEEADSRKIALCDELEELLQEERPDWFRDEVGSLRKRWQETGRSSRSRYKELEQRWKELNDRFEEGAKSHSS